MPRWTVRSPAARRGAAALLTGAALGLGGCAGRPAAAVGTQLQMGPVGGDVPAVRAVVTAFVLEESRGAPGVDTLLAPGADFIVTGTRIATRPRLAGVPGPGTGSVEELRIQVAGDRAWASASYSWVGADPAGAEVGLATFILQRQPGGWRILHVHSSHVARWDR
jgi:hypothetical protein